MIFFFFEVTIRWQIYLVILKGCQEFSIILLDDFLQRVVLTIPGDCGTLSSKKKCCIKRVIANLYTV